MSEHTRRLRCPINRQDSDAGHLCQSRIVVLSTRLAHGPGNHLVITQAAARSRKDPPPERTSEGAIPASRDARRPGRAGPDAAWPAVNPYYSRQKSLLSV